ncbi:MAG: C2 domain-containing protein [Planctomycetota bacterium]
MAAAEPRPHPDSASADAAQAPPLPSPSPAPVAAAAQSARNYPVGPRDETARRWRDEPHGRPLRIGLLGTSGAGKTTYQTALSYVLVRQNEGDPTVDEPLFGHPVGQETRQFLSVRVHELIGGNFPLPTNDATNLFYRIESGNETRLISILDYRGGDLPEIYSRDVGKPLPPALQEVADYFADCDAYVFLVNARTLLLRDDDPEFQRFWNEFLVYKDVLQHLVDSRPRFRGKISDPFALVATQTDAVDLDNPAVRQQLDRALDNLQRELERHVRYPETFLTSAIGRRFIDPATMKKLPHARLEPENVLAPLRFILRTRRLHRRLRRRLLLTSLSIILLGGVILGLILGKLEAEVRLKAVVDLGQNLDREHVPKDAELEGRLRRLEHAQDELGIFSLFLTSDSVAAFKSARDAILAELDEREYARFSQAANGQPVNLEEVNALARDYLRERKYLDRYSSGRPHAEQVLTAAEQVRRRYDEEAWAEARRVDSVEAYGVYLQKVATLPDPLHRHDAQQEIKRLQRDSHVARWSEIVDFANRQPGRYEAVVRLVHDFRENCPPEFKRTLNPPPDQFFQQLISAWDEQLWSDLNDYYRRFVDIPNGSITANLRPCIDRLREYLTQIGTWTVPAHEAAARERIAMLEVRGADREYTIRLISGSFKNYDEEKPDIYIKVFVNGKLKFTTEANPKYDNANPVWNIDFPLRWKAYDIVRVEVWDQDPWPNGHDHIFQVEVAGIDAIQTIFGKRIYYGDSADPDWVVRFAVVGGGE